MKKIFCYTVFILIFNRCTDKSKIAPLEAVKKPILSQLLYAKGEYCSTSLINEKTKTRYIFIIDHSIVNIDTSSNRYLNGTDLNGAKRYQNLISFINNSSDECSSQYAMILMADNRAYSLTTPDVETNPPELAKALGKAITNCLPLAPVDSKACYKAETLFMPKNIANCVFEAARRGRGIIHDEPIDSGPVNYATAITRAATFMRADASIAKANNETINYVIVLIASSGPFTATTTSTSESLVRDAWTTVEPTLATLLNLKSTAVYEKVIISINVNTYLYTNRIGYACLKNGRSDPNCPTAFEASAYQQLMATQQLLQKIASSSQGTFTFPETDADFLKYENIRRTPVNQIKTILSDMYVHSPQSVWWNGTYQQDSDEDGLPDAIETSLGSNPNKKDSDMNGVSDLIEYRLTSKACGGAKCEINSRTIYSDACDRFIADKPEYRTLGFSGPIQYPDSDKDGINDCEKALLQAIPNNPVNNRIVPDTLMLKNNLLFTSNLGQLFAKPFNDKFNTLQLLKKNLPVDNKAPDKTPEMKISVKKKSPPPTDPSIPTTDATPESSSDDNCYTFEVENILVTDMQNPVEIIAMESPLIFNSPPILRYAKKSIDKANANDPKPTITFESSDFKSERP